MKHNILPLLVLVAFALPGQNLAQAQPSNDTGKPYWAIRSFDMGLTNRGMSVGGTWRHYWNRIRSTPFQLNMLFYKESDKIPVYDPWTRRYYEPESKKIVFLNLRTGYQHRIWADAIAANVQPYLLAAGGPTFGINPENTGGFFSRWEKTTISYTANLFVGGGVDFVYSRSSQFSVTIGYEVMYFPTQIDGLQDYSGISVMLSFGERL